MYPSLSVTGSAMSGNFIAFQTPDIGSSWSGGAQLAWEMDFWGKFRRANEAARAELLATEFAQRQVQINLISELVESYFSLLDYRARLYISEQTLSSRDSSEEIINARFKSGLVPELDLNQAQIQTSIAKANVPKFKRLVAKSENGINILLGRYPELISEQSTLEMQQLPDSIPV